jgi:hypothetical protein
MTLVPVLVHVALLREGLAAEVATVVDVIKLFFCVTDAAHLCRVFSAKFLRH